jgi:hypothetical protein
VHPPPAPRATHRPPAAGVPDPRGAADKQCMHTYMAHAPWSRPCPRTSCSAPGLSGRKTTQKPAEWGAGAGVPTGGQLPIVPSPGAGPDGAHCLAPTYYELRTASHCALNGPRRDNGRCLAISCSGHFPGQLAVNRMHPPPSGAGPTTRDEGPSRADMIRASPPPSKAPNWLPATSHTSRHHRPSSCGVASLEPPSQPQGSLQHHAIWPVSKPPNFH